MSPTPTPCVPLAHIVECRADKQVVLDDSFIPTVLHARAAARLATFMTELLGLLHQRGEALGGRVAATGRGGAAEIADFLMLQAINRYEPLLAHFADSGDLHPGSCSTDLRRRRPASWRRSRRTSKRPPKFPAYRHDRLRESFEPVIAALRESLSAVLEQSAIPIPIEPKKFGISVAIVADRALYSTRGVRPRGARRRAGGGAAPPLPGAAEDRAGREDPRSGEPAAARRAGAAGAGRAAADSRITPASRTSSSIRPSELWEQLKTSGGVAMHVAGEFPGLAMEFWAIRS